MSVAKLEILSVKDQGIWRGRRTWEVRLRSEHTDTTAYSVPDVETREEAIEYAVAQERARKSITQADREAVARQRRALERTFR